MPGWTNLKDTLAEPNYRVFTLGNIASLIGTWVQRVAIGWLTWELTRSETWLGLVAFADLFPMVLVAPIAGAYADRADRLRTTVVSQTLLMIQASALFALSVLGLLSIIPLLLLTLFGGFVTAFNQPARMALLPELVDRTHVTTAVAVNSIVFNTARFLGPALAGLILVWGDASIAFLINAITFGIFVLALMRIRLGARAPTEADSLPFYPAVVEGYSYVRNHAGLAAMLLMLAVISLLVRPILELLPSYADRFQLGVGGFALFTSVIGVGAMLGGAWLAFAGTLRLLTRLAFANGFLLSLALLVAALSPSPILALGTLAILGFGMVVAGIASQTIIQLVAAEQMRGRVLAIHGVLFRGGPALGALIMGAVSDVAGLTAPLVAGAVVTFAFSCWMWRQRRRLLPSLRTSV